MSSTDHTWPLMSLAELLQVEQLAMPDNTDMLMQLVPRNTNTPLKGEGRALEGFDTPVQVVGWRWGEARRADVGEVAGQGRSAISRMVTDFTVIKLIDQSSPLLAKLCCHNERLDHATLKCLKAGGQVNGGQVEYLSFKVSDAVIRNYQIYTSHRFGQPLEVFQLAFRKLEFTYATQTGRGGKGATTSFVLDMPGGSAS